ncbi:choloylglycine hydrolase family protein [Staphylococcus sp. IVB6181]|uniref:choloylglycine hydrolase family protein n=1 Tax=Staphylococcus sp. IVB6181 TaxID=2929481 RepID=UPI0021CE1CA0|nr:choloylglycine hydrolase family protein [Staphylococcus sp. IVB6181]UXV34774.1 choloylglycine hydrolase family protein [Staphylococcus sp. IVB6181]
MCTSLTYTSQYDSNYLARTMDFSFALNSFPKVIPRHHDWTTMNGRDFTLDYGFVGTAMTVNGVVFADGVNEQGLAVSVLYYQEEASYATSTSSDNINLEPEEFIMWALGMNDSIKELKEQVDSVRLLKQVNPALDSAPPLHFMVTDQTGQSVVVIPADGQLIIKENPVRVLTNNPNLEWHYQNLRQYTNFNVEAPSPSLLGIETIRPLGVEAGTETLPGGYTSPSRFVKMAHFRQFIEDTEDDRKRLNNLFKLLDTVSIPRGIVLDEGTIYYTQYQAIADTHHLTYYFKDYSSNNIYKIKLTEELLSSREEKSYVVKPELNFTDLTEAEPDA